MAKFIEISDSLSHTIINVNEITTIDIRYEDASDWGVAAYAKKEGITKKEARESGDVFQSVYCIKFTNGDTLTALSINGNCPEQDELLSLLNEQNA